MDKEQGIECNQAAAGREHIFMTSDKLSPRFSFCSFLGCFKTVILVYMFLLSFYSCNTSANDNTETVHYIIEETTRAGVKTTVKTPAGGVPEITKEWTDPVSGEKLKMMTKTEAEILSNGWEKRTEYVKYGEGEWLAKSEILKNFLRETVSSSRAGLGGAMLTTSNVYNNAGRIVQTVNYDGASVVYNYDELNKRSATIHIGAGQTLDFNPQSFTLASVIALDKYVIDETKDSVENKDGVWWRSLASVSYRPRLNAITTSVHKTQLTELTLDCNRKTVFVDVNGNETVTTESLIPSKAEKVVRTVNTTFGTTNVFHSVSGYATVATNSVGGVTEHEYDGFARKVKTTNYTNGRKLENVTTYHDDGSVATVSDVTAIGTNTTSYSQRQPVAGEPNAYKITVCDSKGNQTINYYSGDGQVYRSEGATYPTETVRDSAGQMNQLHTWRNETDSSDITRWYYDVFTGVMTNKCYADGNGTIYTYLDDGKAASREWARGVTTTYRYSNTSTGFIKTTEYSDSTKSVTNYFNLLEQLTKVEDAAGRTSLGYNSKGRQIVETNFFAVITRGYDSYGRYSNCTVTQLLNPYYPFTIHYSYDSLNRMNKITSIVGSETNQYTYTYLSGTRLISGYTASSAGTTNLTVTRSYEEARNIISAITNSVGSVPSLVSSFTYSNDSAGKRASRIDRYNSTTVTNTFSCNGRNEITNAVMNSGEYSINYDYIGNREQSTVYSGQSTITNTYTANQLNQYTTISGVMLASPTHDADGNLAYDGSTWAYSWDGENRLISASNLTSGVLCEYAYDYQSRRISKTTLTPNPYSSLTTKYIWDGFNIVAEIIIDHGTPATNISYYTWGLDISGTLQGAGGVGGLLAETKVSSAGADIYYSVGDANGNITEYIDAAGTVKAHYAYSITGEEICSSGTMADDFTHRFRTKPYDKETRLVHYVYRPYDPVSNRFLSRDPMGEDGGINIYSAMRNNPINMIDPLGLDPVGEWIKKIYFRKWWWQRRFWEVEYPYHRNDGTGNTMANGTESQMDTYYFQKAKSEKLSSSWKQFSLQAEQPGEFWYLWYDGRIDLKSARFWLYQSNQVETLGGSYEARCKKNNIEIRNTRGWFRWNDYINSNASYEDLFSKNTFAVLVEFINEVPEYISGANFKVIIDWRDNRSEIRSAK